MLRKSLTLLTALLALPAVASAWTLQTRVNSVGGYLTVNGGAAQYSSAGTVTKTYASTATASAVVTASAPYRISSILLNGVAQPITSAITAAGPYLFTNNPAKPTQALVVAFTNQPYVAPPALKISEISPQQSALVNQTSPVSLKAKVNVTTGTTTFIWSKVSPADAGAVLTNQAGGAATYDPAKAGLYTLQVKATNNTGGVVTTATAQTTVKVYDTTAAAAAECQGCHGPAGVGGVWDDPNNPYNLYLGSKHNLPSNNFHPIFCQSCHVGADTGAHPGQKPTDTICSKCHTGTHVAHEGKYEGMCLSCHNAHSLAPTSHAGFTNYVQCGTCHESIGSEFWNSFHWVSHKEYDPETMRYQLDVIDDLYNGIVTFPNPLTQQDGVLDANNAWQTQEKNSSGVWGVVTCAYRCHFRPGLAPAGVTAPSTCAVIDPVTFVTTTNQPCLDPTTGRTTTTLVYKTGPGGTSPTGIADTQVPPFTYVRSGGNGCIACHEPASPGDANA